MTTGPDESAGFGQATDGPTAGISERSRRITEASTAPSTLVIAQALLFVTQAAGTLLLSRASGAVQFSAFAKWSTIFALSYALTETWSSLAVLRQAESGAMACAARALALARGAAVAVLIVGGCIWAFHGRDLAVCLIAGGFAAISLSWAEISRVIAISRGRPATAALGDVLGSLIGLAAVPVLLQRTVNGTSFVLYFAIICTARACCQSVAGGLSVSFHEVREFRSDFSAVWRRNYAYTALVTAARNVDNVVVSVVYGAVALGIYARSFSLLLAPIIQVSTALGALVMRQLYAASAPSRLALCGRWTLIMALPAYSLVLGSTFLAATLVRFVLGPQWSAATGPITVLSVCGGALLLQLPTLWLSQTSASRPGPIVFAVCAAVPVVFLGCLHRLGFMDGLLGYMIATVVLVSALVSSVSGLRPRRRLINAGLVAGLLVAPLVSGALR